MKKDAVILSKVSKVEEPKEKKADFVHVLQL